MAFLANDAVNRVNLHYGFQALAQGAGGVFFLVFLLRAGLSAPGAMLVMAAIVGGRFLLRPTLVPLAKRFGMKPVLIAGGLGMSAQYPLLAQVHGPGPALWALIGVSALADVLYWPTFNAYFAVVGDDAHRGHQIGAREALAALAGVLGPIAAAAALTVTGPVVTFGVVGLIQAAGVVPLLGAPDVPVAERASGVFKAARGVMAFYAADGWFDAAFFFVWQIALYVSLKDSIPAYGGAMALAGLVGAACGLIIGPRIDAGLGRIAVLLTYGLAAVIIVARAQSLATPWLAVGANALGALLIPVLSPTVGAALYTLAKASPCPLRFQVWSEAGWDVGCFAGCVAAAALIAGGGGLAGALLLAVPGIVLAAGILWRMYPRTALEPA